MHADNGTLNDLSGAFTVLNTPGAGCAEEVYENALPIELRAASITVVR